MSDETHAQGEPLGLLTLAALGVVFGDIGTSPLYAFREAFIVGDLEVTERAVLGVLSMIVWALVLLVTLKYVIFVMRADNDGEGGILALTSLIIGDDASPTRRRTLLITVGLFGTALLYGDGMITPAISVLSAVEGLEVAVPALESWVLAIAALILVILFSNQHRGTARLGALFGPVMVVWFSVLALLGAGQILSNPSILRALSPTHAISYASSEPAGAFLALGGVFLVATGCEALYADMGHFGTKPIRIGWFGLVFPALLLNYFGQGALALDSPEEIENIFYELAPGWAVIPLVVLATAATVIASQALISGAYSLTSQAIQLGYLPRQHIDHTSAQQMGQIYISTVNFLLMVASVALVFSFGSSSALAAAYGVGVATMLVITAALLYVVMRSHWGWSRAKAAVPIGAFMAIDLVFFGANITKVPHGGWFPLAIGLIGFVLMSTWKRGTDLKRDRTSTHLTVERFLESIQHHPQRRVEGTGVYLFRYPGLIPPSLLTNLRHHEVLHQTVVLTSVSVGNRPRVHQAERAEVTSYGDGFHQVVLNYGFMERPDVPRALHDIVHHEFGFDPVKATYFLGREDIVPSDLPGMALWREHVFAFLHRNAASASRLFQLPPDRVVEVGVQVEI